MAVETGTVLNGIFQLAGEFISGQLLKPDYDEQERIRKNYYKEMRSLAVKEKPSIPKPAEVQKQIVLPEIKKLREDLTTEKIGGGTACLPCSRDHLSTVSGALNEAIRFSRREGVGHPEVGVRVGVAIDELNAMERFDLAADKMVQLRGEEKELAEWALNTSGDLRHDITAVKSHEDLEKTAAKALDARTEFMKRLWNIATLDGSVEKLCKGLSGEEYNNCAGKISKVLIGKKNR